MCRNPSNVSSNGLRSHSKTMAFKSGGSWHNQFGISGFRTTFGVIVLDELHAVDGLNPGSGNVSSITRSENRQPVHAAYPFCRW